MTKAVLKVEWQPVGVGVKVKGFFPAFYHCTLAAWQVCFPIAFTRKESLFLKHTGWEYSLSIHFPKGNVESQREYRCKVANFKLKANLKLYDVTKEQNELLETNLLFQVSAQ